MNRTLKAQILSILVAVLLAQTIVIIVLTFLQKREMKEDVLGRTKEAGLQHADRLARSAWLMCDLVFQHTSALLQRVREGSLTDITEQGGLRLEGEEDYEITSATTGAKMKVRLPRIFIGQSQITLNPASDVPSPFCDRLGRNGGLLVTFWQRINPEGDMLRLSASWLNTSGRRTVGTFQRATEPIWQDTIRSVLAGKSHFSTGVAGGKPFAGLFYPVYASTDRSTPIGMIGLGLRMEEIISSTATALGSLEKGERSYIGVLRAGHDGAIDPEGRPLHGLAVLGHKELHGYNAGENIWDLNVDNEHPAQDVIKAALLSKDGNPVDVRYKWLSPGEGTYHWKNARAVYFAPFDWCIFAGVSENEFQDIATEVDANLDKMLLFSVLGSLLVLVVAALLANLILQRIIRPLKRIAEIQSIIATGDLVAAKSALEEDKNGGIVQEAALLREAASRMTASLLSLVTQAQRSSVQLVSSANQIRATANTQEATVDEFSGHVTHVAAAIREISATSQELSRTMQILKCSAGAATDLANTGKESLSGMEQMLQRLSDETRSISAKLAHINEKTNNISTVITTITKVAEQTNLLSLNAAIEAEKAGEYGLGFSVVAREIRHLADQTAVATLDIERMVKETQASVSVGVMEMDRFSEDVRASVTSGCTIREQLSEVIGRVQELNPQFEKVSEGMEMQSIGARQISESMTQLNDATKNLANSFREFNEASDGLRSSADAMREEVARFRVN